MIRLGASLLLCLCAAACDTVEDPVITDGGPYPSLDVIQLKGYHRSAWYQSEETSTSPPAYTGHDRPRLGTQLAELGARVFHFGYQPAGVAAGVFTHWDSVSYRDVANCVAPLYDHHEQTECEGFVRCADYLLFGSPDHPTTSVPIADYDSLFQHGGLVRLPVAEPAPIFILFEYNAPNYSPGVMECIVTEHDRRNYGYIPEWDTWQLEAAVRNAFDRDLIFGPRELKRGYETHQESLAALGWPRMEELRGQFVFILLDEGAIRDGHEARVNWNIRGAQDPDDPVIFTLGRDEDDPNAAFFSVPAAETDRIRRLAEAGYIVHAYSLDAAEIEAARLAGAHLLTGLELEHIGLDGPVGCNPVTTPLRWAGCQPDDFER